MINFILGALLLLICSRSFAVCSSPISRTNSAVNSKLASSKYNLDLNTVYTRANELPGDCITNATVSTAKLVDSSVTTTKIADASVTLAKLATEVTNSIAMPPGVILPYGGSSAPAGYLLGNGAAVSRTTYAALFAIYGEMHGQGDDVTTFNLPDCRGRFMRFTDSGAGRDPDAAGRTAAATGANAGDLVGSVQDYQIQSHNHIGGATWNNYAAAARYGAVALGTFVGIATPSGASTSLAYNWYTSNSGGNETRPVNLNVNCIIKY